MFVLLSVTLVVSTLAFLLHPRWRGPLLLFAALWSIAITAYAVKGSEPSWTEVVLVGFLVLCAIIILIGAILGRVLKAKVSEKRGITILLTAFVIHLFYTGWSLYLPADCKNALPIQVGSETLQLQPLFSSFVRVSDGKSFRFPDFSVLSEGRPALAKVCRGSRNAARASEVEVVEFPAIEVH